MLDHWRDAGRWLSRSGAFFLPQARRKALDRRLRGREEHRKLQLADHVLMSWGKSGRTWLRIMLSRFYQIAYGVPEDQMQVVVAAYAAASTATYDDFIWAKYRLGEAMGIKDPATGQPAARNIWYPSANPRPSTGGSLAV